MVDPASRDGLKAAQSEIAYLAAGDGDVKALKAALKEGASPLWRDPLPGADGTLGLHHACLEGHEDCVIVLLKAGGPELIDMPCDDGITPLFLAADQGHVKITTLLLQLGADSDMAEEGGRTPLFAACSRGYPECAKALLVAGAGVDLQNKSGATPLYVACQEGHEACVEVLIKAGADLGRDLWHGHESGLTPLRVAESFGNAGCAKRLVKGQKELAKEKAAAAKRAGGTPGGALGNFSGWGKSLLKKGGKVAKTVGGAAAAAGLAGPDAQHDAVYPIRTPSAEFRAMEEGKGVGIASPSSECVVCLDGPCSHLLYPCGASARLARYWRGARPCSQRAPRAKACGHSHTPAKD